METTFNAVDAARELADAAGISPTLRQMRLIVAALTAAYDRGVEGEREVCANIAKKVYEDSSSPGWVYSAGGSSLDHLQGEAAAADRIEVAIRARTGGRVGGAEG